MNSVLAYTVIVSASILAISCAGNRINRNPLFMDSTGQEESIIYTGKVSCNHCEGLNIVLKFRKDQSYIAETVHVGNPDEVISGKGTYSAKKNRITLHPSDSVTFPLKYSISKSRLLPENDTVHSLSRNESRLVERYWKLVELNGSAIDTGLNMEREAHAVFKILNDRIWGSGGCNRYSGLYEIQDQKIRISNLISTKMACMDVPYESEFFRTLETAREFLISVDTLYLIENRTKTARLILSEPGNNKH